MDNEKRFEVTFRYNDAMSNYKWREQKCSILAKNESYARIKCAKIYDLDECEHEITKVEEVV